MENFNFKRICREINIGDIIEHPNGKKLKITGGQWSKEKSSWFAREILPNGELKEKREILYSK